MILTHFSSSKLYRYSAPWLKCSSNTWKAKTQWVLPQFLVDHIYHILERFTVASGYSDTHSGDAFWEPTVLTSRSTLKLCISSLGNCCHCSFQKRTSSLKYTKKHKQENNLTKPTRGAWAQRHLRHSSFNFNIISAVKRVLFNQRF